MNNQNVSMTEKGTIKISINNGMLQTTLLSDRIRAVMDDITTRHPSYTGRLTEDRSKTESGIVAYVVSLKHVNSSFPRKTAIYCVGEDNHTTITIVNGTSLKPLFVNRGKNGEDALIKYLTQILEKEILFAEQAEDSHVKKYKKGNV